jgi:hypothetical protein
MTSASIDYAPASVADGAAFIDACPKQGASVDLWTHKTEDALRLKAAGKSADCIAEELGLSRASVLRLFRFVERASAG